MIKVKQGQDFVKNGDTHRLRDKSKVFKIHTDLYNPLILQGLYLCESKKDKLISAICVYPDRATH